MNTIQEHISSLRSDFANFIPLKSRSAAVAGPGLYFCEIYLYLICPVRLSDTTNPSSLFEGYIYRREM